MLLIWTASSHAFYSGAMKPVTPERWCCSRYDDAACYSQSMWQWWCTLTVGNKTPWCRQAESHSLLQANKRTKGSWLIGLFLLSPISPTMLGNMQDENKNWSAPANRSKCWILCTLELTCIRWAKQRGNRDCLKLLRIIYGRDWYSDNTQRIHVVCVCGCRWVPACFQHFSHRCWFRSTVLIRTRGKQK